jgi:DNA repair exonuclease SbcCD ATPase subunit
MDDKQYASVRKYAWWNDTDQTIEIDWDAINKVKDSEQGDLIKEYVSKLEGFQSQYDEQIEALEDIESTLQEIQERGQEEYTSLEDRTRDALIKQIQDKIDELTAVDEAINDTNQKLMDSI